MAELELQLQLASSPPPLPLLLSADWGLLSALSERDVKTKMNSLLAATQGQEATHLTLPPQTKPNRTAMLFTSVNFPVCRKGPNKNKVVLETRGQKGE